MITLLSPSQLSGKKQWEAMEKEECAEPSQALTMRPLVLPCIPSSLWAAWNINEEKLRKTRIFNYLAWIQSITRVAYVDKVVQFVQTQPRET